jgi:hypothetical protein
LTQINNTMDKIIDSGDIKAIAPKKPGPKPKELTEGTIIGLPVGRDKKIVPPPQVEELASLGCTDRDIANFFGIKEDTLRNNFADNLVKGREDLKVSLRRAQLKLALSGNAVMLIWLGKNLLGQSDSPVNTEDNKPLPWSDE